MKRTILIGLIIGSLFLLACGSGEDVDYTEFAKCISENDVVFYGAFWCPHCSRVKKNFGKEAWQYVNYINAILTTS